MQIRRAIVIADCTNTNLESLSNMHYNGNIISAIGNPHQWYDGTTFTWVNGRRLASAVNSETGLNLAFTYDADGLRLTKTVGNTEHKYIWQGSKLVSEYYDGKELEFFYDESGNPYAFSYKASATATPVTYYYLTNLQGDVTAILDADGNIVAEYTYDAWGKPLSSTGTLADVNPLRYRGYYYDAELEMYYLKSRYYDPEICRFINADDVSNLGANSDVSSLNLFSYCGNNPINRLDPNGADWESALKVGTAFVVIGILAIATIATGGGAAVLAGVGISATAATTAATATVATGITIIGGTLTAYFAKESKKSGKEKANDKPSWANRESVDSNMSAQQNATSMLNEKYGPGNWKKGPGTEFNQIVKWITRSIKMFLF